MATRTPSGSKLPTNKIMVPKDTNVSVGCTVLGGFADSISVDVTVVSIVDLGNYLELTLNVVPWTTPNIPTGVTNEGFNTSSSLTQLTLGYTSNIVFHCINPIIDFVDAFVPTETMTPKTLSFKENVKGWVSFKSFYPDVALSMANDYYTLFHGNIYKHHVETEDRNTFYKNTLDPDDLGLAFTPSTIDVMLNDTPSSIKEFNTLNYEGSQSKVIKFTSTTLSQPFQTSTTYNDQEYYNLEEKPGWSVDSIITNDEDGYIDEFLDKEGKWFNNIKRKVDLNLDKADASDFSFQGIAELSQVFHGQIIEFFNCYKCNDRNEVITLFEEDSLEPVTCPEGWSDTEPICGSDNGLGPSIGTATPPPIGGGLSSYTG